MRFSNDGMWGRAVYFAKNSVYSNNYCHTNSAGNKQMFYAKVNIGHPKEMASDSNLKLPPEMQNADMLKFNIKNFGTIRFDSVKGNTMNCDVYMVYSNKKAYPSYLISYK